MSFFNPYSTDCLLSILEKCIQFCCTRLLRSSKLVDRKKVACFNWKKSNLTYVKLNEDFIELSLVFLKATESCQKMAKTNIVRKMAIGVAQRLRFKKQANTSCGVLKEGSFWSYFDSFLLCNAKIFTKKSISSSIFSFINPWRTHCLLKILKKCIQVSCTGLLCSSKLVHWDGERVPCFTRNLMRNFMSLVLLF